ncbi:ATP-dependent RNA helicase HrpA [Thalassotalea nanhaiensis]|uniref:ATP-dependent RNA helicase HrpA n=1 Tax=Thalassotalea nanhaiensis TaxID=3065648 RepID=A0ABY9TPH0_9GAMM|nr:ATP-dependent RNA helicase HrpA [Colwelliaceae bacterium SQ345]
MSEQPSDFKPLVDSLFQQLRNTRNCDRGILKKRLHGLKHIKNEQKKLNALSNIEQAINQSITNKVHLLKAIPKITYPEQLPVSQSVDKITKAIKDNQVVIIAGETGSGKTTQIPKICLELGRGIEGFIGHTQPRRIAARTVANRIAEEMHGKLGEQVGYKVRFTDQVSSNTYIKLMTDGILLAEMQRDRLLRQYDTIIIDEAHERSLNIDFILGYLKQILPKRPDLKIIITSATIDPMKFSKHFNNAPIIEVSGRTYPVDIHYSPLDEQDGDYISGIIDAVGQLDNLPMGDILVFLNGEREIRDVASALEKENLRDTQILPLFSRLTVAEQNKIFAPHRGRNIVLATNVAETSLTVPGIRYVIDPGTARISRYSYRTKVQRLPIEPISQASANQRSGRCGRVAAGVCIRLYSEEDFLSRAEFTDPEILRTNLATVILQMLALGLGDIGMFPFLQAPDSRNINDGMRLLEELAAIKSAKSVKPLLTDTGRSLSKFPIDPRLAKMLLSAKELGCSQQVAIIVAALSIQDPRERPMEKQQAADQAHSRFKDKESDYISLLNLFNYIRQKQQELSNNQFRQLCKKEYLSYLRIREWQDIISQLKQTFNENKWSWPKFDPEDESKHDILHQAILSGLLSHIGNLDENREYKGARNSKFYIFPGSGLAKKTPKWIMATELVETSRLFARMCAKIDPAWLESLGAHLLKRSHSEPHWEKKRGEVQAFEQVSLYGLVIVPKRKIAFSPIEPDTCRKIFIREALVNGDCSINEKFLQQNNKLVASIEDLEDKARRKDFLVEEEELVDFYLQRIPEDVVGQISFLSWWKKTKAKQPELLNFSKQQLLKQQSQTISAKDYPVVWQQGNISLALTYNFEPGADDDGISINIPVGVLNQIEDVGFEWLIPALRLELITALIRSLPKQQRKNFVPAPNYANACFETIAPSMGSLVDAIEKQLLRMTGVRIPENSWDFSSLTEHLKMNFKVLTNKGKLLKQGRDLTALKEQLQGKVKESIKSVAEKGIERENIKQWDFNDIPKAYEKKVANLVIQAFPALVDKNKDVAIELFEHKSLAEQAMLKGLTRLVLLNIPSPIKYLEAKLPNKAKLGLYFNPFGKISDLLNDCIEACAQQLIKDSGDLPYEQAGFDQARDLVRAEIADKVLASAIKLEQILSLRHDIAKKMKGNIGLNIIQAHGDIKQQLETLVFKGFVSKSGVDKLDNIVRYLKGILRRMEKLPIDPNQDRLKMIEVQKAEELYTALLLQQPKNKPTNSDIVEIKWMIEEFRVSVFAQNLGTSLPISLKRIKNKIAEF